MQITDNPSQPCRRGRIAAKCHLQYGFVLLRDDINRSIRNEDLRPVVEWPLQIEAKLFPILGDSAPAALCKGEAVDRDPNRGQRERFTDSIHGMLNDRHGSSA